MLTASSLQLIDGAEVTSSTFGSGNGGSVTVSSSGAVSLSGTSSAGDNSGIFVSSNSTGQGGNAGDISLAAASLAGTVGGTGGIELQWGGSGRQYHAKCSRTGLALGGFRRRLDRDQHLDVRQRKRWRHLVVGRGRCRSSAVL